MPTLLIVDDEKNIREGLKKALKPAGYKIILGEDGDDAERLFMTEKVDLLLLDIRMPGQSGLEVLEKIQKTEQPAPVIFMTGHGSVETAVKAMRLGAYDFMTKPINLDKLEIVIARALKQQHLVEEHQVLSKQAKQFQVEHLLLGRSRAIKQVIEKIELIAPSKANVYIYGESGTGKEVVCEALHFFAMPGKPLVKVNCAALTPSLLESELFGHVKGAFTGAEQTKIGRFEAAHGGTIFLDEISEIPKETQVKLLRVLQEKKIERVGSTEPIEVDIRIVSASNKHLEAEIKKDNFREDLFFRLNVVDITIPPLRERKGDIEYLAKHFFDVYAKENRKVNVHVTNNVFTAFSAYEWPGNVRELKNVIERMVVLSKDNHISHKSLPMPFKSYPRESDGITIPLGIPMEEVERRVILETIRYCQGNKSEAAQMLEIGRRTLQRRLTKE